MQGEFQPCSENYSCSIFFFRDVWSFIVESHQIGKCGVWREDTSDVDLLRMAMPFKLLRLDKVNRSDHERSGARPCEESFFSELGCASNALPVSKSMVTHSSRVGSLAYSWTWTSRFRDSKLLARENHRDDAVTGASVGLALCSPPIRRFRSEIKSAPIDDDRRILPDAGVSGGFLRLGVFSIVTAAAFSCAATPRAARLNDSEFRKSVPRALLRSFSLAIMSPDCDAAPVEARESAIEAK